MSEGFVKAKIQGNPQGLIDVVFTERYRLRINLVNYDVPQEILNRLKVSNDAEVFGLSIGGFRGVSEVWANQYRAGKNGELKIPEYIVQERIISDLGIMRKTDTDLSHERVEGANLGKIPESELDGQ